MATFTPLSTIITRINSYQDFVKIEEQFKVQMIDESIRAIRRQTQLPWTIIKGSLKVFDRVLEYPVASDHDELAYLDRMGNSPNFSYEDRARFRFTSLQQFYENLDYRNDMAEIWTNGTRYLGVRLTLLTTTPGSVLVNNAETASQFSATGDAATPALDQVTFIEGQGSISTVITASSNTATITNSSTAINDSVYRTKYYFRYIYLPALPASITLRFGSSAANYFSSGALTTQFSGAPFVSGAWNLLAFNLDGAAQTGTVDTTNFSYEAVVFTTAPTGTYFIDASYMRRWELLDYWYYSRFNVGVTGATTATKEYFNDSTQTYTPSDQLIGDSEWVDVIQYDAMMSMAISIKDQNLYTQFKARRDQAWQDLSENYPSLKPIVTTQKYRFITDFNSDLAPW